MAQYTWTYYNNQELPSVALDPIKDETGTAYDFSSGWTFAVRLCRANAKTTTLLLKTTGITGSSAGVVTIAWATTDWDGLAADTNGTQYVVYLTAARTSDGKTVDYKPSNPPTLLLKAAPGTSAVAPGNVTVTVDADTVTVTDAGGYYDSTEVEGALQEAGADLAAHLADTVDAHDASAISVADAGGYYTGTNVETVLAEIGQTLWPWYGFDVVPRELATGTTVASLGKDNVYFKPFTAPQDMVVTGVSMASTATVSAGLTLARFGLVHIGRSEVAADESSNWCTWLARTASDTTLFNVANTLYTRSFSTTGGWPAAVRLVKGERYAVAYMIAGTTAPTVVSIPALIRAQVNAVGSGMTSPLAGGRPGGIEAYTDFPPAVNFSSMVYDAAGSAPWYNISCDPASTLERPIRTVLFGDSYVGTYAGWFSLANAQAGSPLLPFYYSGVGGNTTTQALARIANVTSRSPQVVIVSIGINDVANTVAAATIQANLTTIYQTLIGAGAKVILCTLPPTSGMDAGELVTLAAVNTWIKALNVTNLYISDTGNALTTGDGVTQNAGLYADGTHPNSAGCAAMANVLDDTITTVVAAL